MHEDDYLLVLHDVRSFEVDDRLEMYTRTTTALCYINQHIQINIDITYSYGCPGVDHTFVLVIVWFGALFSPVRHPLLIYMEQRPGHGLEASSCVNFLILQGTSVGKTLSATGCELE